MSATRQIRGELLGILRSYKCQAMACSKIPAEIQELSLLDVVAKYHDDIRNMLAPFVNMCSGMLKRMNANEHLDKYTYDSWPFCSAPYRAGPKT